MKRYPDDQCTVTAPIGHSIGQILSGVYGSDVMFNPTFARCASFFAVSRFCKRKALIFQG